MAIQRGRWLVGAAAVLASGMATAQTASPPGEAPRLLFRASADATLTADHADGEAKPNFQSAVRIVPTGRAGGAIEWADDGYVAWKAPGNMYARAGTLGFFWRSRTPVGAAPFVIFRAGFADHTSWDMTFLRIDWNGHGFDAFVTDNNLARERVSFRMPVLPSPTEWHHIAFAWDETVGVRLFVDGKEAARKDGKAVLDAGLDQFGLAGRVIAPHQVQSRYSHMRGSDVDEIRVYDRMLDAGAVASLAAMQEPAAALDASAAARRTAFLHRYGFDHGAPPVLATPVTAIRKVEFADAKDLKEWMWKGIDGIAETTWPGVYNRSRLPGRDDYFELPDWNVYVEGGKNYDLTLPAGESVNRVEIEGAAYGTLSYAAAGSDRFVGVARRAQGVERSVDTLKPLTGGMLRFSNVAQETPIQEIWAYDVQPGAAEPAGTGKLSYVVDASASPAIADLAPLNAFIAGRYAPEERSTVVAVPPGATRAAAGAGAAIELGTATRAGGQVGLVHVLIPADLGPALPGKPLARAYNYTFANAHDGLDGIALDIPALDLPAGADGLIPLNIQVKDPIWPERDMIDVSVSVRRNEKRTLWLDLRDRILTNDPIYLSVASGAAGFGATALNGMAVRLVFKDRQAALKEHIADRFNQVKDNWGYLVEEHTASAREALYRRVIARADVLTARLGYRTGSVAERIVAAFRDPAFLYSDSDAGRDAAVADMNQWRDDAWARVPLLIGAVPAACGTVAARRMTRVEEAAGRAGYRTLPQADRAPGAYFVDLKDIRRRPRWSLASVAHHELIPGHMIQLPIEARAAPHPLRLEYAPAWQEGWAIHAEQLMAVDDDRFAFGQVHWLLFRTARALLDTGIHTQRWSIAEARARVQAMMGEPAYFASFDQDVERVCLEPGVRAGEAVAWLVLRDAAARARDRRAFHQAALVHGRMRRSSLESIAIA